MRITHGLHPHADLPSAVTIGNFDGVHRGHQAMLQRLVTYAHEHRLIATAITFEPHPREWFSPDQAPARLSSLRDKLTGLSRCGIDHVHICPFNAALANLPARQFVEDIMLRRMQMRHLLIGDDFRFGARRAGDFDLLQQLGKSLGYTTQAMPSIVVDQLRVSSTAIREALAAADFGLASRLLGQNYRISGHVIHGDKRGRQLGVPTANIKLNQRELPLTGVFMVNVHGIGFQHPAHESETGTSSPLPAIANVGMRPTVAAGAQPRLEVHVLDFNGNLYGKVIEVEFMSRLRDEQRFAYLAALKRQIDYDITRARAFFKPSLPT